MFLWHDDCQSVFNYSIFIFPDWYAMATKLTIKKERTEIVFCTQSTVSPHVL